jgi:RNA polymerase subunit RPABC4/transcription elongation factor Spt4
MCGCHVMNHGHQESEPVQTTTITPTAAQPGRVCPNCGYGLRDDFGFCPRCGLRLSPLGTCRYCGRALEPDWTACPSCGASAQAALK